MQRSIFTVKRSNNRCWSIYLTCFLMVLFLSIHTSIFTNHHGISQLASYSNSFILKSNSSLQTNTSSTQPSLPANTSSTQPLPTEKPDPCRGRYIYIHDLPAKFNTDIIKDCKSLNQWYDICSSLESHGLGPQVISLRGPSWFATNQFFLEMIFHNRMKQYECLTDDSSLASLVYVPYYAGLDVGRYLFGFNATVKDALAFDIIEWLVKNPRWSKMSGQDHFLVVGRDGWDLSRKTTDWGSQFLLLPETKNMSVLIIEAVPNSGDFGIPYPSYFHPSKESEVSHWQDTVRLLRRPFLFSFAGGPRPDNDFSLRGHIIRQCMASKRKCKFLNCHKVSCENVINVMGTMESSRFCLQPPGDSFTRRSAFDSILAGCIPVFFHEASAYIQYKWHLPDDYTKYSVFIPENDIKEGKANIEKVLSKIPEEQVMAMKEEVVRLIPKISYAISKLGTTEDAFDIAIDRLLERVNDTRELSEIDNGSDL